MVVARALVRAAEIDRYNQRKVTMRLGGRSIPRIRAQVWRGGYGTRIDANLVWFRSWPNPSVIIEDRDMNILLIGGTGTVGSQTVRELLRRNVRPSVLTRSTEKVRQLPAGVRGVIGNLFSAGNALRRPSRD